MPATNSRDPLKAVWMLLLATVCWGISFPMMKALLLAQQRLLPGTSEWFLVSQTLVVRFGAAALVMLFVCGGAVRRLSLMDAKLGIGLGLFAGLGTLFQMAGLGHTLASTSAFLTQFYVLLIPVILALYRCRLPSPLVWVSCALVVVGMGVLCGVDWRNFRLGRGEWLTLLAAVIYTGQILWLDRREFAGTDKRLATLVQFAVISVMFLPMSLVTATHPRDLLTVNASTTVVVQLAFLVVVCAVVAFSLMNAWQPRIHPTHAGLVYCAEPVSASLYALFLPEFLGKIGGFTYANEQLTAHLWVGGALITAANVLIQFVPQQREG